MIHSESLRRPEQSQDTSVLYSSSVFEDVRTFGFGYTRAVVLKRREQRHADAHSKSETASKKSLGGTVHTRAVAIR